MSQSSLAAPPRNVVLVGFMGSGKSTIGRGLARRLGWRFVDTDDVVRRAAGGRNIPDLFRDEGEATFRDRESDAICEVAENKNQVIATGGGAVLRPENTDRLRAAGTVVWLTARPDVVVARTARRANDRPLLAGAGDDLLTHILKMLGERGPCYQAAAHLVVDTSDRPPHAIVEEVHRKTLRTRVPAAQAEEAH
jgi:shikimate kinase